MTISSAERNARAVLPFIRFLQDGIPLPLAQKLLRSSLTHVSLGDGVRREAASIDGVRCDWVIPDGGPQAPVLLYLHGGGFVFGQTPQHLQMAAFLARRLGMRILLVDYRLGPEFPYPAALDDCTACYRWLRKQGIAAGEIVVAGDSAGGNLTVALLMKLRDAGEALPAAAACLSPVTDLTRDHSQGGLKDPLLPPKAMRLYTRAYLGGQDAHDALISPALGNLHGLPPLLIFAGEREVLRPDAVRLAELADAAGVDVRLEVYPRMWHVWQIFLDLPEAVQSLEDLTQFLKAHLEPAV